MVHKDVLIIDQVLHGYDRGHRALAGSMPLDEYTQATMLVLSDLLTITDLAEGDSYVTGYPIRSSNRYVLARTWSAGPKYRPGSVWTHSLVLDYSSLTLLADLTVLLSLFREPQPKHGFATYDKKLRLNTNECGTENVENGPRAAMALVQLYGETAVRNVVVPSVSEDVDAALAFGLWRQMWPALRREFAFMSSCGTLPSELNAAVKLSFSHSGSESLALRTKGSLSVGQNELLDDLPQPGPTKLRAFLSRYVIESQTPRRTVVRLAALYAGRSHKYTQRRLEEIRSLIAQESLPRLFKELFLNEVEQSNEPGELISLIRTFKDESLEVDLGAIEEKIAFLSDVDLKEIISVISDCNIETIGQRIFSYLATQLPQRRVAALATRATRHLFYAVRPSILQAPEFWPNDDAERAELIRVVEDNVSLDLNRGLEIFEREIGPQTLEALLEKTTSIQNRRVAELLLSEDERVTKILKEWLVKHYSAISDLIRYIPKESKGFINELASLQVQSGSELRDPKLWAQFILDAKFEFNKAALIIGYEAALLQQNQSSIELGRLVFDPLQSAIRKGTLQIAEETYLKSILPPNFYSWSLSSTLTRSAVHKWPLLENDISLLTISKERQHLIDIVGEIYANGSANKLALASVDPRTPAEAKIAIDALLRPAKQNSLLFWWL
jgi:hypothetical protein